jgi:hypothetical protein
MKQFASAAITAVIIFTCACNATSRHAKVLTSESNSAAASRAPQRAVIGGPVHIPGQQGQAQGQGQPRREGEIRLEESVEMKLAMAPAASAIERKIIRNAELGFESKSPSESLKKISGIAEKHGGFVVLSESNQNESRSEPATMATLILRVPAAQFTATVDEVLGVGDRVLHNKISGNDVTEEFVDVEARLRAKRALEMQFLEIMKQSRKVSDALEVQSQLSTVRTEIEQLEGRRRYLENQAALSTINISLRTPAPMVTATTQGFWSDLKSAIGDGVDGALAFVLGVIRVVIACIPVAFLIVLPGWLLLRRLRPRISWFQRSTPAPPANS